MNEKEGTKGSHQRPNFNYVCPSIENGEVPTSVHLAALSWNQFLFILGWSPWEQQWDKDECIWKILSHFMKVMAFLTKIQYSGDWQRDLFTYLCWCFEPHWVSGKYSVIHVKWFGSLPSRQGPHYKVTSPLSTPSNETNNFSSQDKLFWNRVMMYCDSSTLLTLLG